MDHIQKMKSKIYRIIPRNLALYVEMEVQTRKHTILKQQQTGKDLLPLLPSSCGIVFIPNQVAYWLYSKYGIIGFSFSVA